MSIGRLLRLAESPDLDPRLRAWLAQGVLRYLDEGTPLEQALQLQGSRYRHRLAQRNEALRKAWASVPGDLSPWARTAELSRQARRFVSTAWPRIQHQAEPPERLTEVQHHLFCACKAGLELPSLRRIHDVCSTQSDEGSDCADLDV